MSALDLTALKDEYMICRHMEKRMEMLMFGIFPEATAISKKIKTLKEILETTQLTLTQMYQEEFPGTGRSDSSFGVLLSKLIAEKLGAPNFKAGKKAPLET